MPVVTARRGPRRSTLFVSGVRPEDTGTAIASGADVICFDLEDAVPPGRKAGARAAIVQVLGEGPGGTGVRRLVRINCLRSLDGIADVLALAQQPLPAFGVLLPKVNGADEIRWAIELLDAAPSAVEVYCIIESNEGLEAVRAIARASPRLGGLYFGGFDMSSALGAKMAWEPLLYARSRAVHAAALGGIDIFDSPFPDLRDADGLAASIRQAAELGFSGKAAKDASQVAAINRLFTPDAATIAKARHIVAEFEKDPAAPLVVDGKLIELPTVRAMRRVLAIVDAAVDSCESSANP